VAAVSEGAVLRLSAKPENRIGGFPEIRKNVNPLPQKSVNPWLRIDGFGQKRKTVTVSISRRHNAVVSG